MLGWAVRSACLLVIVCIAIGMGLSAIADRAMKGRPMPQQASVEPAPSEEPQADDEPWNELTVHAQAGGHFVLNAQVNGARVRFLLDTGASDIVLAPDDARRLGFHPARLAFTKMYATANGEVRAAPVTLREMRIGQLHVYDLPATVNEAQMPISLLGVSFLARLQSYEVRDDRLVLRW